MGLCLSGDGGFDVRGAGEASLKNWSKDGGSVVDWAGGGNAFGGPLC